MFEQRGKKPETVRGKKKGGGRERTSFAQREGNKTVGSKNVQPALK